MSKKLTLFFVALIFFYSCQFAFANLSINEIMYDLSGADSTGGKSKEWIEVYNPDSSDISIDASLWRIYDGSLNRTINGEVNFTIHAGSFVIFAGDKDTYLADHPGFVGVVYDTGITSLNNTGANLKVLNQDGSIVDSVIYTSSQGAAGDGNSLQKIGGVWVGAVSTPGATNDTSSAPTSTSTTSANGGIMSSDSDNNSGENAATSQTKNKIPEESKQPQIKTQIIGSTLAFVGSSLPLQATAFGYSKEPLHYGKYFWNFGDGDSKEIKLNDMSDTGKITHTYFYPGDYVVSLEYYMNSYGNAPDASDKLTIKVIPVDILISEVGDEKDFFVELSNNTSYDEDISSWVLSSSAKSFIFPKNTVIGSKKKIIISSKLTNFSISDKDTLKLMTAEQRVVFDYASPIIPVIPAEIIVQPKPKQNISASQDQNKNPETVKPPEVAPDAQVPASTDSSLGGSLEDLEASAVQSDAVKEGSNNLYTIITFAAFLGVSAGAVYFIRQRKTISNRGDDFSILDE